jgi:hypothetical protein
LDENDGPSLAFENQVGLIGSESFSLDGHNTSTPEAGNMATAIAPSLRRSTVDNLNPNSNSRFAE